MVAGKSTVGFYLRGFDGLRAVSVVLVLQSHLAVFENWVRVPGMRPGVPNDRLWPLIAGSTGVVIFFVLSGFLITTLLLRERDNTGGISIFRFMMRRTLRVMPPLASFLFVVGVLMFFRLIPGSRTGLVYSCLYFYNFVPSAYYTSELGHTWSLAVEEHFYLLWPWVVKYVVGCRRMVAFLLVLILIVVVCSYSLQGNEDLSRRFTVSRWTFVSSGPILIGCLFGVWHMRWSLPSSGQGSVLIAMALYASSLWLPQKLLPVCSIFQATGVGLFLLWMTAHPLSVSVRFLELPPLAVVGRMSYGIYIWQGLFLRGGPTPTGMWLQRFPQNLAVTLIVAAISYVSFERYFLRLKTRFATKSALPTTTDQSDFRTG